MLTIVKFILTSLLSTTLHITILPHGCDSQTTPSEDVIPGRVSLFLKTLPEPFSDKELPIQHTNDCYEYLGCIETIPIEIRPFEPNKLKTTFRLFRENTFVDIDFRPIKICSQDSSRCELYPYDLDSLYKFGFNPRKRTIVITPGYKSETFTKWQVKIKDRWLHLEDVNLILVGWEGGNHGIYEYAVANTKIVARQITVLLYYISQISGLSMRDEAFTENLYFVGHSLGAHISGFVGKDFAGSIARITGLDPAGPQFKNVDKRFRLDKGDAQLVDAMHTNGCSLSLAQPCYGLEEPIAHLDYYANNGKHQPQCNSDAFGCSHLASFDYYISFLDHEKYMRDYLSHKHHDFYRLFAISGQNYEDFHRGLSISRLCPVTSLNDHDLHSEDIKKCTIPIDFISPYDKFKKELIVKYNIDFEQANSSHYFYTNPAYPYINNHNLIKMRVTKNADQPSEAKVCDLVLHIVMESGAWMKYKIKEYSLLDEKDHYEIILPYISTDTSSKYELARLDALDFFLNETEHFRLLTGIKTSFPKSIELIGLQVGQNDKVPGLIDMIKNFLGLGRPDLEPEANEKSHHCSLNVETISVQPFKKIHRHFIATYSVYSLPDTDPDIIILNEDEPSPKVELLHGRNTSNVNDTQVSRSRTFIDTVIIGPRDESEDNDYEDEDDDANQVEGDYQANQNSLHLESSNWGDTKIWIFLTISVMSIIVTTMVIVLFSGIQFGSLIGQDKQSLIRADNF